MIAPELPELFIWSEPRKLVEMLSKEEGIPLNRYERALIYVAFILHIQSARHDKAQNGGGT